MRKGYSRHRTINYWLLDEAVVLWEYTAYDDSVTSTTKPGQNLHQVLPAALPPLASHRSASHPAFRPPSDLGESGDGSKVFLVRVG